MPSATNPDTEMIKVEVNERGVAVVSLFRPEAANARNQQMRSELAATWRWIAANTEVTVVVLTATGDRHFCAGMDLKEAMGEETPDERRTRIKRERDIELLAHLPQPTIAAINGAALGGGLEMALACDLRVIADEARVGLPEVTHSLMPGGGGTVRLPRLVGPERAFEMLYLGRVLTGPEAVEAGIARMHVPGSELQATAEALADEIASRPRAALLAIKEAVLYGLDNPESASIDRELEGLLGLLADRATKENQ